jgi:hypothetical protein
MAVRYLVCPQCGIMRFQVKNDNGDSALVMITREFEVVQVNPDEDLTGYDLNFFYCLGCSWKGGISKLKKFL